MSFVSVTPGLVENAAHASLFASHGQEFHALNAQTQEFHAPGRLCPVTASVRPPKSTNSPSKLRISYTKHC